MTQVPQIPAVDDFDLAFKVFHELMARKVSDILLVSSLYDAYIMEEEGRLAQRIIHEYRGLNLSRPPFITYASTAREAMKALAERRFDFVITTSRLDDMPAHEMARDIKAGFNNLPVFLLAHNPNLFSLDPHCLDRRFIDRIYLWRGNADLFLALIKSEEDRMNVEADTHRAMVRVVILVEDSPAYFSAFLPILYKEIVSQTQDVMEESLNEEHRFFRMRARPKILLAESYEEAEALYRRFKPYLLSILSDVRFPRSGRIDPEAGIALLKQVKSEIPDIPLLLMSTEESNQHRAGEIPATFLNKNSPMLHQGIRQFFKDELGFGAFVFQMPDGREVARVSSLRQLERVLPRIPEASILHHASRNDFSRWLMARSEILMASRLKPVKTSDFETPADLKTYLIESLRQRRRKRQRGIVMDFDPEHFDTEADFIKIGRGSLGGKARGLAFMASRFKTHREALDRFGEVRIQIPKTVVITTEGFDDFIETNHLTDLACCDESDTGINEIFLKSRLPDWLEHSLRTVIESIGHPLAVRSSGLLEDVQYQPFSRLYQTLLLPNSHPEPSARLDQLARAVKQVYASMFRQEARIFARSTQHRTEQEKMAVMIQQLVGSRFGSRFYPALSGKAQSFNYYPVSGMKPDDGIAIISAGLGSPEGEDHGGLRFSPNHPQLMPQFSTVEDILQNSQKRFFAMELSGVHPGIGSDAEASLMQVPIDELPVGHPIRRLCSSYIPDEHRIRDASVAGGIPVLTFAPIIKFNSLPLPDILRTLLDIGRKGMGGPVEIEFAMTLPPAGSGPAAFNLLQIRPMTQLEQDVDVVITEAEAASALASTRMALGNGRLFDIHDVVWVDPATFDPVRSIEVAAQVGRINAGLRKEGRRYLLVGPGRWGSSDRWLGIPVSWTDISEVAAIVETSAPRLKAEASQGSHFFQNITSAGIFYLTILDETQGFIRQEWFESQPVVEAAESIRRIRLERPLTVKVDGRRSRGVIMA
ncbi:MAG: PEP/pyruvate-binding domain-containing protein [Desulfobacterales bacterium]